jgi:hypothetical protein
LSRLFYALGRIITINRGELSEDLQQKLKFRLAPKIQLTKKRTQFYWEAISEWGL